MKYVYTIEKNDVGKLVLEYSLPSCSHCGKKCETGKIYPYYFMARILPIDIGKRIYKGENGFHIENDEQRDKRLSLA